MDNDSVMRKTIELNIAIYHDIFGVDVPADRFRLDTGREQIYDEEESESEEEYDYESSSEEPQDLDPVLEDRPLSDYSG